MMMPGPPALVTIATFGPDGTIILPTGTRPPQFPDQPDHDDHTPTEIIRYPNTPANEPPPSVDPDPAGAPHAAPNARVSENVRHALAMSVLDGQPVVEGDPFGRRGNR